ncbi:hypothetical protein [Plasmodium yoelii yoelii]|uniref:Uncharacterized protein n=1 Tax=Plasmodium yoelii yoelii TaxID=73239 RepID=Q7RG94_PLAYO|nr:hypothetical protein [Plasmodium yoelii yoelii]
MLREAYYLLCTLSLPKYATNEYIRTYTYDNYITIEIIKHNTHNMLSIASNILV